MDVPARRYRSGAAALTDRLTAALPAGTLHFSTPVTAIAATDDGLDVHTPDTVHRADHVVLAVPPALALARIDLVDGLPADLVLLAESTPVWMGAVTKVVAVYEDAFWRRDGLAGAAFSRTGPLREIHDMSGPDGSPAALFGFAPATGPGFRQAVVGQLTDLFGPAARCGELHVQDWSAEHWTSPRGVQFLNDYSSFGHPLYQRAALDGRLHRASTETAADQPGHVESALAGGERAAHAVLTAYQDKSQEPQIAEQSIVDSFLNEHVSLLSTRSNFHSNAWNKFPSRALRARLNWVAPSDRVSPGQPTRFGGKPQD
ncbi:FAD-dependent oxidoreductase [Lentzea alba]